MIDRVFEIAKAAEAGFFGPRAAGLTVDLGDFRWRFSSDARLAMLAELKARGDLYPSETPSPGERLLGIPVDVDEALPPNSVLLEPSQPITGDQP
jgi:hypothetical protein